MAWTIEFSTPAKKALAKMDAASARRLLKFLEERIAPTEDPRLLGEEL